MIYTTSLICSGAQLFAFKKEAKVVAGLLPPRDFSASPSHQITGTGVTEGRGGLSCI